MKTIVLSDLHGYLPIITEPFDLMLICGDISPVNKPHYANIQKEWLFNDFVRWIDGLPFKDADSKVVMCAGNHDIYLENISPRSKNDLRLITNNSVIYLDNEGYEFQGKKIFGCPYCKVFGNWAFMREDLNKYYSVIPVDLDILICHDAPDINGLGEIKMGQWKGENAGNKILAKRIKEVRPKYCFNGHIHSGNHELFKEGETFFANVSIMNEDYVPTYEPLVLDI